MSHSGHFQPVQPDLPAGQCPLRPESGPKVAETKKQTVTAGLPYVVPCSCPARAFLQGKQQGKIRFAIAPMVARCASRLRWLVALPISRLGETIAIIPGVCGCPR